MRTDLSRRIPAHDAIAQTAEQKAASAIHETGRALPCSVVSVSGAIVTVKFEATSSYTLPQVTMPVATSVYERKPIQKGDLGVTVAIDAYVGGVSGLGGGTATLGRRGNLSTLVFVPVGNKGWPAVDPDVYLLQGPNGVLAQDMSSDTTALFHKTQGIIMSAGSNPVSISGGGGCSITMQGGVLDLSGVVQINGQPYLAHTHGNGNDGSPTTGVIA